MGEQEMAKDLMLRTMVLGGGRADHVAGDSQRGGLPAGRRNCCE